MRATPRSASLHRIVARMAGSYRSRGARADGAHSAVAVQIASALSKRKKSVE